MAALHGWLSGVVERDRVFANAALRQILAPVMAKHPLQEAA